MTDFVRKPYVVEAFQWDGRPVLPDTDDWIVSLAMGNQITFEDWPNGQGTILKYTTAGLDGPVSQMARKGDWVVLASPDIETWMDSDFRAAFEPYVKKTEAEALALAREARRAVIAAYADILRWSGFHPARGYLLNALDSLAALDALPPGKWAARKALPCARRAGRGR